MIYILIMFVAWGGKVEPVTQEFNTREACENAIVAVRKDWDARNSYAYCVPKG